MGWRAPVPGGTLHYRDAVPASGLRRIRPQGAARRRHLHRSAGTSRSIRRSSPSSPMWFTASGTLCSTRRSIASMPTASRADMTSVRRLPQSARLRFGDGSPRRGSRRHHPRHDRTGRQRDRRVRHQRLAQSAFRAFRSIWRLSTSRVAAIRACRRSTKRARSSWRWPAATPSCGPMTAGAISPST